MSLTLNHNMIAYNAANNLSRHYAGLSTSVRRLSSGLRVGTSSDDSAGLAIRELMRSDVTALNQGARNANDAISMIQTADGALAVIDEKLIRMKELAEQASTGTYDSTQRLMIDSEYQAMAAEINRIARGTDFNGIKLLDGSRLGKHNGSGLESTGAVKVHFGTGNDEEEDYYYIRGMDATLNGLGLGENMEGITLTSTDDGSSAWAISMPATGIANWPIIPAGSHVGMTLVSLAGLGGQNAYNQNHSIQIFTRDGKHIAGTPAVAGNNDWSKAGVADASFMSTILTEANGFSAGATYDDSMLNGTGGGVAFTGDYFQYSFSYNGMNFTYSGDPVSATTPATALNEVYPAETVTIDATTEDLIFMIVGQPGVTSNLHVSGHGPDGKNIFTFPPSEKATSIDTQDKAQKALGTLDSAIVRKDQMRGELGAMQNRLENTVTNLTIQAEQLQAAESRISDTDVATEMTNLVRNQILVQSSVAMLSQANSLPKMALNLLQ